MSWGAVAGAAIGAVGGALTKDKNGGAGSSTTSNTPYATGDWIKNLAQQGSDLTAGYFANPMSATQTTAYNNQYALSDGMRGLVPSLLGQIGGQQVGFDPSNPTARPQAFDWSSLIGSLNANQKPVSGQQTMTAVLPAGWSREASQAPQQPGSDMLPVEWAQLNNRF